MKRFLSIAALLAVIAPGAFGHHNEGSAPAWALSGMEPSYEAVVAAITARDGVDYVVLDAGYEAGFRDGMACRVFRGEAELGTLILVGISDGRAVALITSLTGTSTLQSGDSVAVRTWR